MNKIQTVYFIGIGGIGMSALARYFKHEGAEVSGYDKTKTELTIELEHEGIQVHYEENLNLIPQNPDLIVITPAVPLDHQEWLYYKAHHPDRILKRAQVLGIISRQKKTIAVGGTHGKTTTSTLISHLMKSGGIDVTAFLGGISLNLGSNFVIGNSEWVVVEADEFDRSFLHLQPEIAIVLSTDPDHLDIYGTHKHMMDSGYLDFAGKVRSGGILWVNDKYASDFKHLDYLKIYGNINSDAFYSNVRVNSGMFVFDFQMGNLEIKHIQSFLPGEHNIENATIAIAIALECGVDADTIQRSMMQFKGIKRRFEILFQNEKQIYIDDYAHHPTELKAAISAARQMNPGKKLTGVFQPHLYSRTLDFAEGFADALDGLDEAILLPIYPAREKPINGVQSQMIMEKMKLKDKKLMNLDEVITFLKHTQIEVLMTIGAGDIDLLRKPIQNFLAHGQ
jgi:UDP-N-acetylmuramate--alanine ligase